MSTPPRLGKYQIRRELGKGSMGVVYEAFDTIIQRSVAIKVIREAELDAAQAAELLVRLKREAQAAGRLNHPNIVSIYDYGEESFPGSDRADLAYIAMEIVLGRELKAAFDAHEHFALIDIERIMGGILAALAHAHQHGVVHRDIKPANVILLPDGRVKVTDFGVARIESSDLTQTGVMLGTPLYMSPEQILGHTVDGRSDLFSAGVMLYQFLTGDKPFSGNVTTVMQKVLNEDPVPPSHRNHALAAVWDNVLSRAMAKRVQDRFQTAAEFADAIRYAVARQSEEKTMVVSRRPGGILGEPRPIMPAPVPAPPAATPAQSAATAPAWKSAAPAAASQSLPAAASQSLPAAASQSLPAAASRSGPAAAAPAARSAPPPAAPKPLPANSPAAAAAAAAAAMRPQPSSQRPPPRPAPAPPGRRPAPAPGRGPVLAIAGGAFVVGALAVGAYLWFDAPGPAPEPPPPKPPVSTPQAQAPAPTPTARPAPADAAPPPAAAPKPAPTPAPKPPATAEAKPVPAPPTPPPAAPAEALAGDFAAQWAERVAKLEAERPNTVADALGTLLDVRNPTDQRVLADLDRALAKMQPHHALVVGVADGHLLPFLHAGAPLPAGAAQQAMRRCSNQASPCGVIAIDGEVRRRGLLEVARSLGSRSVAAVRESALRVVSQRLQTMARNPGAAGPGEAAAPDTVAAAPPGLPPLRPGQAEWGDAITRLQSGTSSLAEALGSLLQPLSGSDQESFARLEAAMKRLPWKSAMAIGERNGLLVFGYAHSARNEEWAQESAMANCARVSQGPCAVVMRDGRYVQGSLLSIAQRLGARRPPVVREAFVASVQRTLANLP